jgi:hypothetical protein
MIVTPAQPGVQFKNAWIPAYETVSQLAKRQMLLFCHSGLDPESSVFLTSQVAGCRIKSGMTVGGKSLIRIMTQTRMRESSSKVPGFPSPSAREQALRGNDGSILHLRAE